MWNLGDGFACSSQPGGSTRYYDGCVSVTRPCAISGQWARGSTRFAPDHSHHILLQDTKTETEPRETYTLCRGSAHLNSSRHWNTAACARRGGKKKKKKKIKGREIK